MPQQETREHAFVNYLKELASRGDRAALAALHRAVSSPETTPFTTHRYVVPWLPERSSPWRDRCYYLVAALFAGHPLDWPSAERGFANFGASFARLDPNKERENVERRFTALLNTNREELSVHLRHAVALLRAASSPIPVDWALLLRDIQLWNTPDHRIQRRWARAFWGSRQTEETQPSPQEASDVR